MTLQHILLKPLCPDSGLNCLSRSHSKWSSVDLLSAELAFYIWKRAQIEEFVVSLNTGVQTNCNDFHGITWARTTVSNTLLKKKKEYSDLKSELRSLLQWKMLSVSDLVGLNAWQSPYYWETVYLNHHKISSNCKCSTWGFLLFRTRALSTDRVWVWRVRLLGHIILR